MSTTSIEWVDAHFDELQEKFAGKYIAIVNSQIISVGDSFEEVSRKAKRITKEEILIDFIDRGDLHAYNIRISCKKTQT